MLFKIFDKHEKFKFNINDPISAKHLEEINGKNILDMELDGPYNINKKDRILYKDRYNRWKEFIVNEVEIFREEKITTYLYCENSSYEMYGDFILDRRPTNASAREALKTALETTRWEVGYVDDLGINSITFYRESAYEALHKIINRWGGEIQFRIEVRDNKITNRYVDLYRQRGQFRGKRYSYTKDLLSINKRILPDEVVTALYGFGKGEEIDGSDGFGRRIDFGPVEWLEEEGDPTNKPYKQMWVGLEENRERWGRLNPDGSKSHVFDKVEFDDIEIREELLLATWEEYKKRSVPQITYAGKVIDLQELEGSSHEGVILGDTVYIIDREFVPELRVKARIVEYEEDLMDPTNDHVVIGNISKTLSDDAKAIEGKLGHITSKEGIWDRSQVIGEDLKIHADHLEEVTAAVNRDLNSRGGYVYLSENGEGIITYDKPIDQNPTMAIQILGGSFRIADGRLPNGDWNWKTFGTGEGFVADYITTGNLQAGLIKTGILESGNGKTWINMENGLFNFHDRIVYDGKQFYIDLSGTNIGDEILDMKVVLDQVNKQITTKVSVDELGSLIEQNKDHVKIAVGKFGGENYVINGSFISGRQDWEHLDINSPLRLYQDDKSLEDDTSYITVATPTIDDFYGYVRVGYRLGVRYNGFDREEYITRAQTAEALYSVYTGPDEEEYNIVFSDYEPRDYGYHETMVLVKAGVLTGYEDGTFKPNQQITKEEICSVIVGSLGLKKEAENYNKTLPFTDVPKTRWSYGVIGVCYDRGYIEGETPTKFGVRNSILGKELMKYVVLIEGKEAEALEEQSKANPQYYGIWSPKFQIPESDYYTISFEVQPGFDVKNMNYIWVSIDGKMKKLEDVRIKYSEEFKRYHLETFLEKPQEYMRLLIGTKKLSDDQDTNYFGLRRIQVEQGENLTAFAPSVHEIKTPNVTIDRTGVTIMDGSLTIKDRFNSNIITANGIRVAYAFTSSGEISGWQRFGIWDDGGILTAYPATISFNIPRGLVIETAKIRIKSAPRYFTGWSSVGINIPDGAYHGRRAKLYKMNSDEDFYIDYPALASYSLSVGNASKEDVTQKVLGISEWNPKGRQVQVIEGSIVDYIQEGTNSFAIGTNDRPTEASSRYGSGIQIEVEIVGYLRGGK